MQLMSQGEVIDLVMALHREPDDLEEGDLIERLSKFERYELRHLPLTEFDLEEWIHDDELSDKYCDMLKADADDAPPIIYDPSESSIIDGIHRANGYFKAGRNTIPTLVGVA